MNKKEEIIQLFRKWGHTSYFDEFKYDLEIILKAEETPPEWAVAKVEFYTTDSKDFLNKYFTHPDRIKYTPIKKTESELKPCPFCGGIGFEKIFSGDGNNNWHTIKCYSCWSEIGRQSFRESAINLWNKRV